MGFTEGNTRGASREMGLSFGASMNRPLLPSQVPEAAKVTNCFSDSVGPLASQPLPPERAGAQPGENRVQSPRPQPGQKLLWDLGL